MAVVEDAATIIRPSLGDYVGVDNNRWDDDNIGTFGGRRRGWKPTRELHTRGPGLDPHRLSAV
eukprot:CAMPEP_0172551530 /NCGR_PEP_ID=MMETSP1067-20121228/40056_1 /TAXON_ID=265564 ORGANISM="Thalassiosira punctigera, Strain Tpunct2005C2" /NCGR_SAMPLE_ID=MMETSP1067 /ASSEMBLY_ACC=CAM_ASM_000444 /LENGTH=62 /DNA_ID=CAMNT_0013339335 /DNA_START=127 /DNA_END=315 /DNA_ORIENTATION=-